MNATKIEKIRTVVGPVLVGKTNFSVDERRVFFGPSSSPLGTVIEFAVVTDRSAEPHMVFDTESEARNCLDVLIENDRAWRELNKA